MASIFKEIALTWNGKSYHVTPDMRLINSIEQEVSLSKLAARLHQGDVPIGHMATIISAFLRRAGADASEEDVYAELLTGKNQQIINDAAAAIFESVFPQPKKSEEPKSKPTAT